MAQWCHVATLIWDSIGSGNGLLPEGTKPLPETMLDCHQCSLPDLPGADELNVFVFLLTLFCQLWGHHVFVCYGQMMGANKPSGVSVPWIFVLLICNYWNKRLLNLNLNNDVIWEMILCWSTVGSVMCQNRPLPLSHQKLWPRKSQWIWRPTNVLSVTTQTPSWYVICTML